MKKQESKFSQVKFAKLKICELKKIKGGGEEELDDDDVREQAGNL